MESKIYLFKKTLFFVIINVLIIGTSSFKYYKAFNLLSKNILLITDEGFIKYDLQSNIQTVIKLLNDTSINANYEIDFISFAQFASEDGGYIVGRIRQNIYLFSNNLDDFFGHFTVSNIENSIISIIPFKSKFGDYFVIIGYIDANNSIKLLMYKIQFEDGKFELLYSISNKTSDEEKSEYNFEQNKKISCQLMSKLNNDKILACFTSNDNSNKINAIVYDPEKELSFLYYSNNMINSEKFYRIYSEISPNKNVSLVCIIDSSSYFSCLLYFSESNRFGGLKNFILECKPDDFYMGIKYISEKQEYSGYCATYSYEMRLIIFDENFNVKKIKENKKCYTNIHYVDYNENLLCSYLIYDEYNHNYYISRKIDNDFDLFTISDECTHQIDVTGLDYNEGSQQISSLPSSILSTVSTIISEKSTIIIPPYSTITDKSTIFIPPSSIVSTSPSLYKSTINIPLSSTISAPSTIISEKSTIVPPSSNLLTSSIEKTTIVASSISVLSTSSSFILEKSTTIIPPLSSNSYIKKTTIFTPSSILSTPSSIISENSTLITLTSLILSAPTSIASSNRKSISSTPVNQISTIKSSASSLVSQNITSISSFLYTSIISKELQSHIFNSTILSIISQKNNTIFYQDGKIMKGKINETKEEFQNNLDNFMNNIEIGKIYEINGDDYNVTITPINVSDTHNSTYVDLSVCEGILRKKYNISETEILTIMQIEIDKKNDKSLNNQVEYSIYDSQKKQLNLSYCKDVQIKVNYKISNESLINKSMISYYSELGIDVFDDQDSFFNDICYPFSNSNSDIILKDRIVDIYQNYSLCDNGCEYDEIDIEKMLITCSCQVKIEIDTKVSEPDFRSAFEDTFKESNFGVIKCYNLVFSLKNKKHNFGFMLFLVFVLFHIICFIYYFIF